MNNYIHINSNEIQHHSFKSNQIGGTIQILNNPSLWTLTSLLYFYTESIPYLYFYTVEIHWKEKKKKSTHHCCKIMIWWTLQEESVIPALFNVILTPCHLNWRKKKKSIFDYKMYIPYLSSSYPDKILLSLNV